MAQRAWWVTAPGEGLAVDTFPEPRGAQDRASGCSASRFPLRAFVFFGFSEALQSGCGGSGFRFAELFAGIGGFRLGLESLGGRCVFASEIEPFTREVYTLNFGTRPEVLGDIQMIQAPSRLRFLAALAL